MQPLSEKENVKNVVVSSTVTIPPANSVEIANPTTKPKDGLCNWCRDYRGDIFCDGWPICFDCIDKLLDRENAIGIMSESQGRTEGIIFGSDLPPLWEK
jgi:hypothetical protein